MDLSVSVFQIFLESTVATGYRLLWGGFPQSIPVFHIVSIVRGKKLYPPHALTKKEIVNG